MPIVLKCTVFSTESGTSKNGFFCNIKLLDNVNRKTLELFTKDESVSKKFESLVCKDVEIVVELEQNKFGLRLGTILDIKEIKGVK